MANMTFKVRWMRSRKQFAYLVIWLSLMCVVLVLWRQKSSTRVKMRPHSDTPHLLWWTSMPEEYMSIRYCGFHMCTFSTQRQMLSQAKAVLFYASDIKVADMPLPRLPHHAWALLHEESPRNVPFMPHGVLLQHFNFTSTFSRYSDLPLSTQYLSDLRDLTSPTYVVPIGQKSLLRNDLAAVAFLQSDCDTMSGRDDYVEELMRHIKIDSYGQCLHNRDLPASLTGDYLNHLNSPELYRFLARYKFIIAYENGVCHDYITEKLWRPLVIGSIPIYFGAPTIKDWEPNKKSVIHISDFATPKDLANFINELDGNDTAYNSYLNHKYAQSEPIANKLLLQVLLTREYSVAHENLHATFECFVCQQIHEMSTSQTQMATLSHYDCPQPLVYPSMERKAANNSHIWQSVLAVGRCQAQVLHQLLQHNTNFTQHDFDLLLTEQVQLNHCN